MNPRDIWQSLLKNRYTRHSSARDYWYDLGYSFIGMLYLGFSTWLLQEAKQAGLNRLFFLARDGFVVKRVTDLLLSYQSNCLETSYLFSSRRAVVFPSVTMLDAHSIDVILKDTERFRVHEVLERFDIKWIELDHLAHKHRLSGSDYISKGDNYNKFRALLHELEDVLLKKSFAERNTLVQYLSEQGVFDCRVGLVDIGWHGSTQFALTRIARQEKIDFNPIGFYLGTYAEASKYDFNASSLRAYLFNFGKPVENVKLARGSIEIFELMFSAPHPGVVRFKKAIEGKIQPVLEHNTSAERKRIRITNVIQRGAIDFVKDYIAYCGENGRIPISPETAVSGIAQIIFHPRPTDLEHLGDVCHSNSMSISGTYCHLAKPPSKAAILRSPLDLRRGYQECFWRIGYKARLEWPLKALLLILNFGIRGYGLCRKLFSTGLQRKKGNRSPQRHRGHREWL